ncbi:MAG TPA: PHB depolymerase family esterase [Usitatibacteraceae bacterium]
MKRNYFTPLLAGIIAVSASQAGADPLPKLNVDKSQTSVSGISSGGYMAVQLHIAYSAIFRKGAGVVAGGPYNCAEGAIGNALGRCFGRASIPVAALAATTRAWAKDGAIDPVENLAAAKVYLFAGAKDSVVNPATSADLFSYYQNFLPAANLAYKKDLDAEHAMITDDFGAACTVKASPFINNCGFDLAGAILQHLLGPLNPRNDMLKGALLEFDQSAFVAGHGMATSGWVYIPEDCAQGAQCRIHVALHGCKQNTADIGEVFVRNAGYNRWADSNRIVVLYPQTGQKAINSCWDWWGYDAPDYAKKSAPQMSAIAAMVAQLGGGTAMPSKP